MTRTAFPFRPGLFRPSLAFVMLCLLLLTLWLAGGASRYTAKGQIVVRAVVFLVLIVQILFGRRPVATSVRSLWFLLGGAVLVATIQLIPLPAGVWHALPGREVVGQVPVPAAAHGLSLVPGATLNALFSLCVPVAVLALVTGLAKDEQAWLPGIVLALGVASMLLGLLQFAGAPLYDPLVNYTAGIVSGTFANHNHFALFLALGCLLVPAWMLRGGSRLAWRAPFGLGLLLLFVLVILASGSRAGMGVGALAMVIAGVVAWPDLRRTFRRAPPWVAPAIIAAVIVVFASLVFASVAMDRAVSIQRVASLDVDQDMRSRAFPTVWQMTRTAFPAGIGLGSFDAAFRVREPFGLLKPTYFNQAHDDLVEVVLDAGLPGLLLLLAALIWWAWASVRAWRPATGRRPVLPRIGSAMLLLVIVASVVDYPARTPLIMAMVVIAAVWLATPFEGEAASALPSTGRRL